MSNLLGLKGALRHMGMGDPSRPDAQFEQRQQQLDDMFLQAAQNQPQNLGQGMTAVAQALNQRRARAQAPQTPGQVAASSAGPLAGVMNLFR